MDNYIPLREYTEAKQVVSLYEDVGIPNAEGNKEKTLFIQGPFLEGGIKNRNGRIYPVEMLSEAVTDFMKSKVRGVGVPGELNHPQSSIQIDLDRVSHYVTELKMNDNVGIGKAKVATTPKGQIAAALIRDGMILGVSTRGVGKLNEGKNGDQIVSEYELITVDIVSDPSAPNAFVEAVMESLQYTVDRNTKDITLVTTLEQLLETIKSNLTQLPRKTEDKNKKILSTINFVLDSL